MTEKKNQLELALPAAQLPTLTDVELKKFRLKLQSFNQKLNQKPVEKELKEYGGARYLPISFIEMTLDEMFFGQWETYDFKWERMFNEVVGSITLEVIHPVTGQAMRRTGAAAIIIQQDKDSTIGQFNETKKKNALDLGFPKLKAECIKNAALSLGKKFGRDLNRVHIDEFNGLLRDNENELNP